MEEAVDSVADRVEEMAEKVEHFVDEIGNELPEGSVLKSTLEKVENIADKIGKDAHMVSDIVDKVMVLTTITSFGICYIYGVII